MWLTIFERERLCLFPFALLRGRTGRRMAEGGRSVKSVRRELWWLPGKRGVPVHTDPNPEGSGRKASRDCHANHEEKKQTAPNSWCQRYLPATRRLKGKSKFLSVILFDSGREERDMWEWGKRRGMHRHKKGISRRFVSKFSLISKGIFYWI